VLFSPGKTRFGLSPATRFRRRSPANWINPGNWAWITEFGELVLVRDRAWLYRDLEGLYLRFPGSVTSEVWRRRVTLSEFVDRRVSTQDVYSTAGVREWRATRVLLSWTFRWYFNFLLFICVIVLVCTGRCFVSEPRVQVKLTLRTLLFITCICIACQETWFRLILTRPNCVLFFFIIINYY